MWSRRGAPTKTGLAVGGPGEAFCVQTRLLRSVSPVSSPGRKLILRSQQGLELPLLEKLSLPSVTQQAAESGPAESILGGGIPAEIHGHGGEDFNFCCDSGLFSGSRR